MQKNSNIYVTITNNVVNFKIRLPWNWCKTLGLTTEDRGIFITYENNNLVIEKQKEILFSDLSVENKIQQINKFKALHRSKFDKQKDFINQVEQYFKITYRTAYRYLKEELSLEELESVKLMREQSEYGRNINLMLRSGRTTVTATMTIPSALAILFLKGKTCEDLGIKNIIEIYEKNTTLPISMELDEKHNKILIKEYLE